MNLCKVYLWLQWSRGEGGGNLKSKGKKNQIKSNGERKVVLIGTCLGGGTGDGGRFPYRLFCCAPNTLILWINTMWITLESYLTCTSTFNQPAHQSAPISKHLQNPAPWPLLGPQHWHLLSLNRSLCFCPHSETKQDPVGLLCTKAFLCPPVFLFIANRLPSAFKTFSGF